MKALSLSIILLSAMICGCSAEPETRIAAEQTSTNGVSNPGVIIDKQDGRVLLVPGAEKQDILNGDTQKILAENDGHAVWVSIPGDDYSSLFEGDIIRYFGKEINAVDASFPAQTEAVRIEVMTPADWTEEERALLK